MEKFVGGARPSSRQRRMVLYTWHFKPYERPFRGKTILREGGSAEGKFAVLRGECV